MGKIISHHAELKVNIGISPEDSKYVCELLNDVLADEMLLLCKARNFHWNVKGIHFSVLHKLFENIYKELSEITDEVAERVRYLGGKAIGTYTEITRRTRLKENPGEHLAADQMLMVMLNDFETIIRDLRDYSVKCGTVYGDNGTQDFFSSIMQKHEKTAWMLRATIEE